MNKAATKTRGAVIVTRVSTGEQDKHGTSPETQLDACRAKAAALSLPIVAEYYDAGISGAFLLSRMGMQAALSDIQEGRADTLLCPNISRYSRDVEHQQAIKKAVRAAGGRLVFCDMDFEDTPEGDLNFTIQGGFAEYERQVIRARTMRGKRKKVEQGIQVSRGNPPYGYHVPTTADIIRGDYPPELLGKYVLVPDQADVIRWVFESYAAGEFSLPEIARQLNAKGVPTARGGSCWRATNLAYMFTNPVYKGAPMAGRWQSRMDEGRLSRANKLTGEPIISAKFYRLAPEENWVPLPAPALVSEDTWDRLQQRLAENKSHRGGNPQRLRLLSGRVFCPKCGARMYAICVNGKYPAVACGRHRQTKQHFGQSACDKTCYPTASLEDAVLLAMALLCKQPDALEAAFAEYAKPLPGAPVQADPRRELADVETALSQLKGEELAAVQAQIAGIRAGASPDVYSEVFAQIAARRKDLEDRRGVLSAQRMRRSPGSGGEGQAPPGKADIPTQLLADTLLALSSPHVALDKKRAFIGTVIQKVMPQKDGADIEFVPGLFGEDTFQKMLGFYLQKLQRDLEQAVVGAQLIDRLVACNFGPNAARPTFHLGALDDSRLSSVGALIKDLVAGNILAPDEPWIRGYLGLPDASSGAIG